MDKLRLLLVDPAWWFTAVFVTLAIGVINVYIAKGLSWIAAKCFGWARVRRQARLAREKERIALYVANPVALILAALYTLVKLVILGIMICSATSAHTDSVVMRIIAKSEPPTPFEHAVWYVPAPALIATLLMAMVLMYNFTITSQTVLKAYVIYLHKLQSKTPDQDRAIEQKVPPASS